MKILLVGSTGFLGPVAHRALNQLGAVKTLGRNPSRDDYIADLAKTEQVSAVIEDFDFFDVIVYLAASVGYESNQTAEQMYAVNAISPAILCSKSESFHRFIYISTAGIHGSRRQSIRQSDPYAPDNPYLMSKWLGQELVKALCRRWTVLKFGGIFGSEGPKHLGINRAISDALKGLSPTLNGLGSSKRNYIYVDDAAAAISWAIDRQILGEHLLAGGETYTIMEMLKIVQNELLPGSELNQILGGNSTDQVIELSPAFPSGQRFEDALRNIKVKTMR